MTDVEGDSEVGMRKSKLVTIYDLKVRLSLMYVAGSGSWDQQFLPLDHDDLDG